MNNSNPGNTDTLKADSDLPRILQTWIRANTKKTAANEAQKICKKLRGIEKTRTILGEKIKKVSRRTNQVIDLTLSTDSNHHFDAKQADAKVNFYHAASRQLQLSEEWKKLDDRKEILENALAVRVEEMDKNWKVNAELKKRLLSLVAACSTSEYSKALKTLEEAKDEHDEVAIRNLIIQFRIQYTKKANGASNNMAHVTPDDDVTVLQSRQEKLNDAFESTKWQCKICYSQDVDCVLHCGHTMCNQCATTLDQYTTQCPYCKSHSVPERKPLLF